MIATLERVDLSLIHGGAQEAKRENLCAEIQEMASRHGGSWSSEQWDAWGEMYDRECAGKSNQ